MVHLLTQLVKYVLIILFAVYTMRSFIVLRNKLPEEREHQIYRWQIRGMLLIHLLSYIILFVATKEIRLWILYAAEVGFVYLILLIYRVIYKNTARLVTNHMCMLMLLGFTVLTRLDFELAVRQFEIAVISIVITILVPRLIVKFKYLAKFTWAYAIIGIVALGAVFALGRVTYGAKISFTVAGITLQPSEFVKIIFVFFVACMLYNCKNFKQVVITTIVAILHVGILVASTDLGAALIFFVTYVIMLYVATRNGIYLVGGVGIGALAAFAASKIFTHVQVRIAAWKDPFAAYDSGGYQVAQSLFAIGTGGWTGMGIYEGKPESIPVGSSDFVFAVIAEEWGIIFALCLILVCFSLFIMIANISLQIKDMFYKLIALGFACVYGVQVFLNIGGVIKCIPSTGVTLPLVSYGGSSIFCTIFMFAIIQGLYILRNQEGEVNGAKRPISAEQTKHQSQPTAGTTAGGRRIDLDRRTGSGPDRERERIQSKPKREPIQPKPKRERKNRQKEDEFNDYW